MTLAHRLMTGLRSAGLPVRALVAGLRPRGPFAFLPGLALATCLSAAALGATLEERLDGLAANTGQVLAFEETRSSGLTREPVTVHGRLEWDPEEERLTKWVDAPRPARLAITPTHLEAQAGQGRTRRLALERRPELAVLLGGIRALLSGDATSLEASFTADYLEGEGEAWVLRLVPRDAALAERLQLLEVRGEGDQVRSIDTLHGDGARETMTILDAERPGDPHGPAGDEQAADEAASTPGDTSDDLPDDAP